MLSDDVDVCGLAALFTLATGGDGTENGDIKCDDDNETCDKYGVVGALEIPDEVFADQHVVSFTMAGEFENLRRRRISVGDVVMSEYRITLSNATK